MNPKPLTIIPDWKWGTPEGSREFDRLHDRRMSFVEKIQWLEEAENLTLAMRASREKLRSEANKEGEHSCPPADDKSLNV